MKRKIFFALFWIFGMLFPVGWAAMLSERFGDWFDWVFATSASHVIAHVALFGVLAMWLAAIFTPKRAFVQIGDQRRWGWRLLVIWLVVAVVAALQELIQLLYKARQSGADERFDIGVDMVGAALGLLVMWSVGSPSRAHGRGRLVK